MESSTPGARSAGAHGRLASGPAGALAGLRCGSPLPARDGEFTALVLKAARSGDAEFFRRLADAIEFCKTRADVRPKQVLVLFAYEELWRLLDRYPTVAELRNEINGTEGDGAIDDRTIRDILKRLTLPVSADKTGRPRKVRKTRK